MVSKTISPEIIAAETASFTLGRSMFLPTRYLADAAVLYHVPFLFWLTERARPRTVLGLGLRSAVGYFALCQAIDQLGLPARAWGYGTWSAANGNGQATLEGLRPHNTKFYRHISHLATVNSPGAALDRFEAGTFDLMLVDGSGELGDPKALASRLVEHASDRGIIVLSGLGDPDSDRLSPARVLFSVLAADHPAVVFDEEDGCGLILVGKVQDLELLRLATAPVTSAAFLDFQLILSRVGEGNVQNWKAQSAANAIADAEAAVAANRKATAAAELRAVQAEMDIASLTTARDAATQARDVALAELQEAVKTAAAEKLAAPPPVPTVDPEMRAELEAARQQVELGHAARLREARVLTAELERVSEELRLLRLDAAQAVDANDEQLLNAANEAAEAARAELAALRIRHFDDVEDLRSEVAWFTQELARVQAAADSAASEAQAAQQGMAQLDAEKVAAVQALIKERQALEHAEQELKKTRQESAAFNSRRVTQLKLREWQVAWLMATPRYGKKPGPSGGKLAEEVAAVAGHRLFDAQWYVSNYPDLKGGKISAAEHFVLHGLFEGRDPGPKFKTMAWFGKNPAALSARKNPLLDANLPESA